MPTCSRVATNFISYLYALLNIKTVHMSFAGANELFLSTTIGIAPLADDRIDFATITVLLMQLPLLTVSLKKLAGIPFVDGLSMLLNGPRLPYAM